MEAQGYEEECKEFHRKRKEVADSAWHKVLSYATYNRNATGASYPLLSDEELDITAEALQFYLRKT